MSERPGWLVYELGGLGAMLDGLRTAFAGGVGPQAIPVSQLLAFTPSAAHGVTGLVLAVFMLQWLIQVNADGTGYLAQRAMACRDDHEARRSAVIFTFAQIVLRSLIWLPIALGLLLLYPPQAALTAGEFVAQREATYVLGMAELLPSGMKGLMLAAMIAALASTVDTHLNWGASYWTNDIYARFLCRSRGRVLCRRPKRSTMPASSGSMVNQQVNSLLTRSLIKRIAATCRSSVAFAVVWPAGITTSASSGDRTPTR